MLKVTDVGAQGVSMSGLMHAYKHSTATQPVDRCAEYRIVITDLQRLSSPPLSHLV
jgi:hypothetical protein